MTFTNIASSLRTRLVRADGRLVLSLANWGPKQRHLRSKPWRPKRHKVRSGMLFTRGAKKPERQRERPQHETERRLFGRPA